MRGSARRRIGALVAAAMVLGLVFTAVPARAANERLLIFKSKNIVVNDGYRMKVTVEKNLDTGDTSMDVVFTKRQDGATQTHHYLFNIPGNSFSMNKKLSKGKLATATSLESYGQIEAKWTKPGGLKKKKTFCATTKTRTGTFAGKVNFKNGDGFFDIKKNAIKGTVRKVIGTNDCATGGGGGTRCYTDHYLAQGHVPSTGGAALLTALKFAGASDVYLGAVATGGDPPPASASHLIVVPSLPATTLDINEEVTHATLTIPSGTPFVSGTQSLDASGPSSRSSSCGTQTTGGGITTGTIDLQFDTPGAAQIVSDGETGNGGITRWTQ